MSADFNKIKNHELGLKHIVNCFGRKVIYNKWKWNEKIVNIFTYKCKNCNKEFGFTEST